MKQILSAVLLLTLTVGCSEQIIERTPVVHLSVIGTVVDKTTGAPIEGLQVTMTTTYVNPTTPVDPICPPVLTDEAGTYHFDYTGTPLYTVYFFIDDIDGSDHGGYYGNSVTLSGIDYSQASMKTDGSFWDFGTIEKKMEHFLLKTTAE